MGLPVVVKCGLSAKTQEVEEGDDAKPMKDGAVLYPHKDKQKNPLNDSKLVWTLCKTPEACFGFLGMGMAK